MTPEDKYLELLDRVREASKHSEILLTSKTLGDIVGVPLTEDYVKANNEYLSESFSHIVASYGFSDFLSLYLAIVSKEGEQLVKGGKKDFSRLQRVKRTVIRNGKPMQTTIYADPSEDEPVDIDNSSPSTTKGSRLTTAKQMSRKTSAPSNKAVANLVKEIDTSSGSSKGSVDISGYLSNIAGLTELRDELDGLRALILYGRKGNYVYIKKVITDGETSGVGMQAFFELIGYAKSLRLGVFVKESDNPLAKELYHNFGLTTKKDGFLFCSGKKLDSLVGDLPWMVI